MIRFTNNHIELLADLENGFLFSCIFGKGVYQFSRCLQISDVALNAISKKEWMDSMRHTAIQSLNRALSGTTDTIIPTEMVEVLDKGSIENL